MKRKVVVATSHVDLHLHRIPREELERMAMEINNGKKPLATVEHDVTLPPIGKALEAWVEPDGDGEYQLVVIQEIFEEPVWVKLDEHLLVFKQEYEADQSPFADRYADATNDFEVASDLVNFASIATYQTFIQEIRESTDIEFNVNNFGRKSSLPDPEFLIRIGGIIATYLISKKALDKTSDKVIELVAEDVAKFYSFIRSIIVSAAKYVRPRWKPITYIFVVSNDPTIEFVARSTKTSRVLSAVLLDKLEQAVTQAYELHERFKAARIQYLLNEQGEWEFSYLLTKTGGVIGTEKSYRRRVQRLNVFLKDKQAISKVRNRRNKRNRK